MNLKCKINGIEYDLLVQGNTFSDEYNETLDSGNIILAHINKIKKLKPFDDVYIYDSNFEFGGYGYYKYEDGKEDYGAIFDSNGNLKPENVFYKHLLVDSYTEEFVNIKDRVYKYKISLMSEIKALEKVQCPNISVTQPLNANKKVSVYEYLVRFVEMYSPKYKKVKNKSSKTWTYVAKYTIDKNLENIFKDVYSPDFSLNAPSLRDILSKLMIVKDMIPYVENGVIKALDITQRKNKINLEDLPCTNIIGSMRSNEYCDALRRNYSEALSQDSTCRSVEYLGFRNSDVSLMTLDNMRLETRFPIYKINKITMCYYKKSIIAASGKETMFLCKQDITPLVKLNTERNVLSKDWYEFKFNPPYSIKDMAEYKMCTVGYDIGSKYITGWGTRYTYPAGWWDITKTYIENIVARLDSIREFGTEENYRTLSTELENQGYKKEEMNYTPNGTFYNSIISPFKNKTLKFKSLLFIVDYQGFFNGSIVHSKDHGNDDIMTNDNSSSSLALLELDGLSQKEKVNRLGNKTYQFTVRYDEYNDLSNLLNLGDYFSHDEEDDIIIYHREIAIYDNYVLATYFAAKDYVLKNYFTSVYARHRTWNLMSYGESITRAENRKTTMLLSKEKLYYEKENVFLKAIDEKLLFSCFDVSNYNKDLVLQKDNKIDIGYICHNQENKEGNKSYKYYLTDVNGFLSGYSLCFNLSTFDNISMGNYIKKPSPFAGQIIEGKNFEDLDVEFFSTKKDYTGSVQEWYSIVDDFETGYTKELGFYVGHNTSSYNLTRIYEKNDNTINQRYENYFFKLPLVDSRSFSYNNEFGTLFNIYKDNKEIIDMTYQIEPISNDKDVIFSSWFMKLNDMLSNYGKRQEDLIVGEKIPEEFIQGEISFKIDGQVLLARTYQGQTNDQTYSDKLPFIVFGLDGNQSEAIEKIKEELDINKAVYFYNEDKSERKIEFVYDNLKNEIVDLLPRTVYYYSFTPNKIIAIDDTNITLEGTQIIKINTASRVNLNNNISSNIITNQNAQIVLKKKKPDETDLDYIFYFKTLTEFDVSGSKLDENATDDDADYYINSLGWEIDTSEENYGLIISGKITRENSVIEFDNGKIFTTSYTLEEFENNVFGVINGWYEDKVEENYVKYETSIFMTSPIEEKPKNMFAFSSKNQIKNTLVYDEYKLENLLNNNDYDLINNGDSVKFSDIFSVETFNGAYIEGETEDEGTQLQGKRLKINLENVPRNANSIQYWYEDNGSLKFVFGVNLTKEDFDNNKVYIYVSLVSNRDPRVYDEYHNVIGKVRNYLDNKLDSYKDNQFYDEEDI